MRSTLHLQLSTLLLLAPVAILACAGASSQGAPPANAGPAAKADAPATPPAPGDAQAKELPASATDRARLLTTRFYEGKTGEIWAQMNETMRSALQSEQKLGMVRQEVESELGVETAVIDEKVSEVAPYRVYLRTASFSKTKQPVIVQWAFEQDGKVAGFFVRPQPTGLAGEASAAVMDRGRALTTQFYAAKTAELWTKMSDAMKSALGSEQKFAGFRQQVESQLGTETKVIDEKTVESPPYRIYVRTASFSKSAKPVIVQWALDGDDIIAGFFVRPGI